MTVLVRIAALLAVLAPLARAQTPERRTVAKVDIVAYINQASGCQKHTEEFLRDLDKRYGDRVELEFVDFGTPAGAKRWRGDGLHCMGIRLNGSTKADIVRSGVPLTVAFEMPAGFMWKHEELETAVRQMLEGVAQADKEPPKVETRSEDGNTVLALDGTAVLALTAGDKVHALADALKTVLREGGVIQEEFDVQVADNAAQLSVRGRLLVSLSGKELGVEPEKLEEAAATRFESLIAAFPRKSRPFPGMGNPRRR